MQLLVQSCIILYSKTSDCGPSELGTLQLYYVSLYSGQLLLLGPEIFLFFHVSKKFSCFKIFANLNL